MAQLKVYFFRHGFTYGNKEARMCGRYDTLVCREGWDELYHLKENYEYPEIERLYTSPAIRCRETASVIYPQHTPRLVENFWEMDFGEIENVPIDCTSSEGFEKWLRQDPDCGFPGGETILECRYRAVAAMTRVVKECREEGISTVGIIAHGEVLGCLLEMTLITDEPRESFTLCPNGMGYEMVLDTEDWFFKEQKMYFVQFQPVGAPRLKAEDSPFFTPQGGKEEEDKPVEELKSEEAEETAKSE